MTEKNYNPQQKERKAMEKQGSPNVVASPKERKAMEQQPKEEIKQKIEVPVKEEKTEKKIEDKKTEEIAKVEEKTKEEPKKEEKKQPAKKIKKEEVVVNGKSVPISTKYAIAICGFIKKKRIGDAIRDLEAVIQKKKSVPMKGEYAHKKGKGKVASGSGKYPADASRHFIVLLKSLAGNATNHEIDEPVVSEAVANFAARPLGRFGRIKRKRTHITIKARELKIKPKKKKGGKK